MLLKPHISEKAIALAETGVYVFDVPTSTNKIEVAKAVESSFKVNVVDVKTLIIKGKPVSRRISKAPGITRSKVKKAMVRIKKGQSIKLFEGAK